MSVEAKSYALPSDAARALEALAERYDKPIEELLAVAVDRYLNDEHEFIEKVEASLAGARSGETVSWDDAKRELREMIARADAFNKAV